MKKVFHSVRQLVNTLCEHNPFLSFMNTSPASPKGLQRKAAFTKTLENTLAKKYADLTYKDRDVLAKAQSSASGKTMKAKDITDAQKFGTVKSALNKKVTELNKQVSNYKPGNVVYSTGGAKSNKNTLGDFMK